MPDPRFTGASRALLISSDRRTAGEFKHLLSCELPQTKVTLIDTFPNRMSLMELASQGIQLCFLDVGQDTGAAFSTMATAANVCPEVPIVALLRANDPGLILQCLRQGAAEFLIHPVASDQLQGALAKLARFHPTAVDEPETASRVFCVMPGKGACGATTVACNLAYALKRQGAGRVLLADLDGFTGTLAFLLKLKSNYSFLDALSHSGSLDADVWKALVTPCHDVDVLLSPENPVDSMGEVVDPHAIVSFSRRMYDTVVVDAGAAYGDWNLALARMCDELLVVGTNELAALHSLQRALAYFEHNGVERQKTRVVINRYAQVTGLLPRDSIEQALETEVFETLPADEETIQKSLMEGKPAASASRFGKSMEKMAQALAGNNKRNNNGEEKASMFSGFLKKITG